MWERKSQVGSLCSMRATCQTNYELAGELKLGGTGEVA